MRAAEKGFLMEGQLVLSLCKMWNELNLRTDWHVCSVYGIRVNVPSIAEGSYASEMCSDETTDVLKKCCVDILSCVDGVLCVCCKDKAKRHVVWQMEEFSKRMLMSTV